MVAGRVTYLLSEYPTPNHVYLTREIAGLRALGWTVDVVSVRKPLLRAAWMAPPMVEEMASVRYALGDGVAGVLGRALGYCLTGGRGWRVLGGAVARGLRHRSVLRELWYAVELLSIARWLGTGHVHGHFIGQFAASLAVLCPGRWSITLHGPDEFRDVAVERLRTCLREAAMVRLINAFGKAQCEALAPERPRAALEVIRLGLPLASLPEPVRTYGGTRLLTVGRLAAVKAQQEAIRALAEVRRHGLDATLTIIGDGEAKGALQEHARREGVEGLVEFRGWVSSDAVFEAMRTADIFLLPSLAEGIPLVLMEAMWQGCSCIATPVGGVPELIDHGVNGFLVPVGDPRALASAVLTVCGDPELPPRLHAAAQQRLRERFDLGHNVRQLSAAFVQMGAGLES